jgi:hypothetical protein
MGKKVLYHWAQTPGGRNQHQMIDQNFNFEGILKFQFSKKKLFLKISISQIKQNHQERDQIYES